MHTLGLDIGSSSVKGCLYNVDTRSIVGVSTSPSDEMAISSPLHGWAEQEPELWWYHVKEVCRDLNTRFPKQWLSVGAIGIAYQMHGLVVLDSEGIPVRPSIIWCDSRAVDIGTTLTTKIGRQKLLSLNLNTPGNFTASKLMWLMENEPVHWAKVATVMLPGDYIAYKLSGECATTRSGLSEMILWDFLNNKLDSLILKHIDSLSTLLPTIVPNMGYAARITEGCAAVLGLDKNVVLTYRSGDQPNNAFGLGVVDPGSVAMNAGTSGVVYAVTDQPVVDQSEAFNSFLHVTDREHQRRIGLLLCLNGCGIVNAQVRRLTKADNYSNMNELAANILLGSDGLRILPFGNGAERMLGNQNPGASVYGWDLVRHGDAHFFRAALEGVAASLSYGVDYMRSLGVEISKIHAGKANLFLSPVFCEMLTSFAQVDLYLYESDGASAAAKGAAFGAEMIARSTHPASLLCKPAVFANPNSNNNTVNNLRSDYYQKISSLLKHKS